MTQRDDENVDGRREDPNTLDIEPRLDPTENIELSNMNHI